MLIILLILTIPPLNCQSQAPNEVAYQLEYTYSQKESTKSDSLFMVSLIIDQKELAKLQRFYVKIGSKPEQSDLFVTALSKETLAKRQYNIADDKEKILSRRGDKILFDLGTYRPHEIFISVKSKDKEGRFVRRRNEITRR